MSAGVEKAHDAWLDAARRAGPALARGMEMKMSDKVQVAGLVSRTKDAELAMGKIYEGIKRKGEKWEDKWEARKARRLGKTMQFCSTEASCRFWPSARRTLMETGVSFIWNATTCIRKWFRVLKVRWTEYPDLRYKRRSSNPREEHYDGNSSW